MYHVYKFWDSKRLRMRTVEESDPELKVIQRGYVRQIHSQIKFPEYIHGTIGTSTATNSTVHLLRPIIYKLDLKDFFQTVKRSNIEQVIQRYNLSIDLENVLLDNRLPIGAPTSPVLANLAFLDIDKQIVDLAGSINYTRYVDDLTFSAERVDQLLPVFIGQVKDIIQKGGFIINPKKSRLMFNFQRQEVTGVVVNTKTNIPWERRNKMRATLDHIARKGIEISQTIQGELAWMKSINKDLYIKLMSDYNKRKVYYANQSQVQTPTLVLSSTN